MRSMIFLCLLGAQCCTARTWKWQLHLLLLCISGTNMARAEVRYSIPEEMKKGSFVGNIAQDLGLEIKRLKFGRARIFTEDSREYIGLNSDKGTLVVNERIDREELCAQMSPCSLHFQIILENPMELHRVTVEIFDINDNVPVFARKYINLSISELAVSGARFSLDSAEDPDVGVNALQTYTLKPTDNFKLKILSRVDGTKYVEMVLLTALDREKQEQHKLVLTAYDGGSPQKSSTVVINIAVLDANDNAPVFTQGMYKTSLAENSLKGTAVLTVTASDADKGTNGELMYSFSHSADRASDLFSVDHISGEITVNGNVDFEKSKQFEITVEAVDMGGLSDSTKVLIDIIDVNDNAPVITMMSFTSPIPEDSAPGTVIAMINVKDMDSGKNGNVRCSINPDVPFQVKLTSTNVYTLVTADVLDREKVSEYNIRITATDEGSPPYSTNKTVALRISDVNDNAPLFEQQSCTAHVLENNAPGMSIFSVRARDRDSGNNAHISYFLDESQINGATSSMYISVNAESGTIYAVRSFDYEQIKQFKISVKAQDGGSPPLTSNVTVAILIGDQNDNVPQILYPAQTGVSVIAEIVPRSAEVGYLVTKVVAIDVDSGQNAWLTYKLLKVPERALFEVGSQNGEIRTLRQVTDKDNVKQKLTVVVEDNGQPTRSATVNVNVAVADSFPEVFSELSDFAPDKDYDDNLTFYLILALVVVSFLFVICIITILSVKCYRWRQERLFYKSNGNLPVIPYYPPLYADVGGTGTMRHMYNYEMCRTTDSRKSQRPCSESLINLDASGTQTLPHLQEKDDFNDLENSVSYFG